MFRLHKKAKGSATKASSRNKLIEIRWKEDVEVLQVSWSRALTQEECVLGMMGELGP
jgi:hypothetical protein